MKVQEESIDAIVEELAAHLNNPESTFDSKNVMRYEDEPFFGWELLLANFKEVKGQPIVKDQIYHLPCPVLKRTDHYSRMRFLGLAYGRQGIINYLKKWVKPSEMEVCRAIVMGKYNEYLNQKLNA